MSKKAREFWLLVAPCCYFISKNKSDVIQEAKSLTYTKCEIIKVKEILKPKKGKAK